VGEVIVVDKEPDWLESLEGLWPFETHRHAVRYLAGAVGYCLLWCLVVPEAERQQVWDRVELLPHLDEACCAVLQQGGWLPTRGRVGRIITEQFKEREERRAFAMSIRWLVSDDTPYTEYVAKETVGVAKEVFGMRTSVMGQEAMIFALWMMSFAHDDTFGRDFEGRFSEAGRRIHSAFRRAIERAANRELGANRGRTVTLLSLEELGENGPEDSMFSQGFEEVEWRMLLESVTQNASPAQREAVEIYLEAGKTGSSIKETATAHGRDPAAVRNNFMAFSRKYRLSQR
jgi:hypothetical protein